MNDKREKFLPFPFLPIGIKETKNERRKKVGKDFLDNKLEEPPVGTRKRS